MKRVFQSRWSFPKEFFPVKLSNERDASGDSIDGEEVSNRRNFTVEGVGPAQPVPDLAIGTDVGVDRSHCDDL